MERDSAGGKGHGGGVDFPCRNRTICSPVVDEPTRNFTAEEPDELLFLGVYFPPFGTPGFDPAPGPNPPPSYCEAPTQEEADQCATQPDFPAPGAVQLFFSTANTCTITCPDGSIVSFTAPAGLFYSPSSQAAADQLAAAFACAAATELCGETRYRNAQQTCEIACPDSSTASYTVAANSFTGSTQVEADGFAYAFACSVASLLCDGDPPPEIFPSTPQSCTVVCPDGGTITITVPAGTALGMSQGEADNAAHDLACALAIIYCPIVPDLFGNTAQTCTITCEGVPVSYTVLAGTFIAADQLTANIMAFAYACAVINASCVDGDPPPPPPTVGNTPQSCSASCGSGTFSVTIGRNQFRLENLAAANVAAQSYACQLANNHLTCLGDITSSVCQNSAYAESIPATGDVPSSWSVSGTLPPGITFLAGSLMGVATTLGTYAFTVTAVTAFGTAVRNYSIAVAGITTNSLPDGEVDTPYSAPVLSSGFSSPFFSIVGGPLPAGLAMASNGAITGTPTASGSSSFVVQVEGDGLTCQKSLSITVAASVQAFWTLDSGNPATNTDSVNGQLITLLGFGTPPTPAAIPGVIGNCVQWFGQVGVTGPGITYQDDASLAYDGNGWTFCFWVYKTDWNDSYTFTYRWDTSDDSYGFDWQNGIAFININSGGDSAPFASPSNNAWHFICFTYHTNGDLYGSVDGAALTLLGTGGAAPAQPGEVSQVAFNSFVAEGGEYRIDLVALFPSALSNNQKNALWNGGAGQSYPPSPGPP